MAEKKETVFLFVFFVLYLHLFVFFYFVNTKQKDVNPKPPHSGPFGERNARTFLNLAQTKTQSKAQAIIRDPIYQEQHRP
jgi:hypothetical protein